LHPLCLRGGKLLNDFGHRIGIDGRFQGFESNLENANRSPSQECLQFVRYITGSVLFSNDKMAQIRYDRDIIRHIRTGFAEIEASVGLAAFKLSDADAMGVAEHFRERNINFHKNFLGDLDEAWIFPSGRRKPEPARVELPVLTKHLSRAMDLTPKALDPSVKAKIMDLVRNVPVESGTNFVDFEVLARAKYNP